MKLTLADPWPLLPALLLAAAVVIAVIVAYARLRGAVDARSRLKFLLARIGAALLLLLLLFEPALSRDRLNTEDLVVAVLVDRSESMSVPDSVGGRARAAVAAEFLDGPDGLLPTLRDEFEVEAIAFAERARPATEDDLDAGTPARGRLSDLAGALRYVGESASRRETVAAILLSDGAENGGGDAPEVAATLGVPVHVIGFGMRGEAQKRRRDLALLSVDAPENVFAGNAVVAEAVVRSTGYDLADPGNRRVRVRLLDGGAERASEWVEFTDTGAPVRVPLRFVPTGSGPHNYRVEMDVRGDETIPKNNAQTFTVNVLDRRAAVLYFDATLRWEAKFLRDFLARDPAIDLTSILHAGQGRLIVNGDTHDVDLSKGLPDTIEGLGKFDVVVIGDVEAEVIGAARLEVLRKWIEGGGGLLTLGGYHAYGPGGYAGSPLAEALPVVIDAGDGQRDVETTLSLTPEGRVHPILSGLTPYFSGADHPRLAGLTGVGREKPGAQVLLTGDGDGAGPESLVLAAQRYGEGRVVAFTGDTTWEWYRSAEYGGPDGFYGQFWGQTMRWLLEREAEVEQSGDPLVLFTDRPSYRIGETVRIRARVRDAEGAPVGDAIVSGTLTGPGDEEKIAPEPVARAPGHYETRYRAIVPGDYVVAGTARRGGDEIGRARAEFTVEDVSVEMDHVDLDDARLMAIARRSGGRYYQTPPSAEGVTKDIRGSLAGLIRRQEIGLSNGPLFFLVFVALLGTEWYLRRRRNLL